MTNRKHAVNKPKGPSSHDQQSVDPVVVLISADAEWRALRKWFPDVQIQTSPYGEWFRCRLPAQELTDEVLFLHGGWGKIAAAGSTQYAISRWSPSLLINLGTCGGLAAEIERGAIILVNRTIVYDIIEQMGDYDEHLAHYTTEIDLSWLHPPYPQDVQQNLLVSADRDILAEQIPWLKGKFGAVAADWESAAIAYVAAQNHTRIIILRAVTDLVAESGGEAYGNLALFQLATEKVMAEFVKALPDWINAGSTV